MRGQLWETDTVSAVALQDEESPRNEVTYAQAIANITSAWWNPTPPPGPFSGFPLCLQVQIIGQKRNCSRKRSQNNVTDSACYCHKARSTVWAQCK